MSLISRVITSLATAGAVAFGAMAPSSAATRAADDAATATLRAALQAVVDSGATGVSALVDDGEEVTRLAVGSARLEPRRVLRPTDQARVGSITKTAVAVLTLQLVDEGDLGLDDTIESWLPGRVPGGEDITIRMLLNHTSGIYNYTDDPGFLARVLADPHHRWTASELIDIANAHPPLFAPGTSWSYSNTGYILIGLVLQKATHDTVADLLQRRITGPLDLDNTYLPAGASFRGPHAHGYAPPGLLEDGYVDLSSWSPSLGGAAGAMVSNPADLAKFYQQLLSGRLLPSGLLKEMTTTVNPQAGFGYGLGIYTTDTPCGTVWGHDGGIPGYVSIAYHDADGDRSAVLLLSTQPDAAIAEAFGAAVMAGVCAMFGMPVPASPAAALRSAAIPGFSPLPAATGLRLSD